MGDQQIDDLIRIGKSHQQPKNGGDNGKNGLLQHKTRSSLCLLLVYRTGGSDAIKPG
jgi:hypothetical protein